MNEQHLLKEFGLTVYETKVYSALVRLGSASAAEITASCAIPSNKVYASLLQLIEKGFVASLDITPKQYRIT